MSIAVTGSAGTIIASGSSLSGNYTPAGGTVYVLVMGGDTTMPTGTLTWGGSTSGVETILDSVASDGNSYQYFGAWRIQNPGTSQVTIAWSGSGGTIYGGMVVYECTGVDTASVESYATITRQTAQASPGNQSVTTVSGDLVIDLNSFSWDQASPSADAGQGAVAKAASAYAYNYGCSTKAATSASTTMTWTWSGTYDWSRTAIVLKAASSPAASSSSLALLGVG